MFVDHAEFTAIKTQEPFQNKVITENWWPNLKHLQPELPMAQLQIPTGTFQCLWAFIRWFSPARGKFTEIHRPIPSAFRDSSRAQQQWHRLILEDHRGDVWMLQLSPSPNIPGTPSAVARRGPAKPLHTQKWREWAPGPAHTYIDTHYLGWGLHSHQDYKNKHNTIKMGISSSSLSPSHPFPVPTHISYYFPEPTKSIWTTQDKIGEYWPDKPTEIWTFLMRLLLQRRQQGAGTQRNNIPMLAFAVPPGCAPTRWHIPETGTPEWPTSPAAPNAAKLHCEERRSNPPATFIALPKTGWGKSFKSLSKIQCRISFL